MYNTVVVFTIDYCHMFVFILVRITRGIVYVVVFTIDYCHMFVFILVRITRGIAHVVVFTIVI
jgi:hypothetical protein